MLIQVMNYIAFMVVVVKHFCNTFRGNLESAFNESVSPYMRPVMMEIFAKQNKIALFLQNTGARILYIDIEEASVCEAFRDFMEHLEVLKIAYGNEESEKRMREMIAEWEKTNAAATPGTE